MIQIHDIHIYICTCNTASKLHMAMHQRHGILDLRQQDVASLGIKIFNFVCVDATTNHLYT